MRGANVDLSTVTLADLEKALDVVVGEDIAFHDGTHFGVKSLAPGAKSAIEILASETVHRRPFVTRASIADDAATRIFGFLGRDARGSRATRATVRGAVDLRFGVDLSVKRFVRISVDGHPFEDIDCAGPRPHATTIDEVADNLRMRKYSQPKGDAPAVSGLEQHLGVDVGLRTIKSRSLFCKSGR